MTMELTDYASQQQLVADIMEAMAPIQQKFGIAIAVGDPRSSITKLQIQLTVVANRNQ